MPHNRAFVKDITLEYGHLNAANQFTNASLSPLRLGPLTVFLAATAIVP